MNTKLITIILCCVTLFFACEEDGNIITVSGIKSSDLMASESSIILSKATASSQVLALTWNKSELSISDTSMSIPGAVPYEIIEVSSTASFDTIVKITPQANTYAFTGAALNTLGKNLKFVAGVSTPMYFRIRTALGINTEAHYSSVVPINITCYTIDMSIGFILDKNKADTEFKLYSPESNGEYRGFTGSGAWYNWYLLEGDGTNWGNLGVDGNAFVLSNDESSQWNFWYPGQSGCYYTTLSKTNKEWTATYIPTLKVSGAINASMTFDKQAVKWYISFTTTSDNATVKVKCDDAKLYNKTTSTDDAAAVAKTMGFIPHNDSTLTFEWNSASAGNITISKAGDYTLSFNLADPKAWKFQIKSGKTVVIEPISKYLYLPGIDDGTSGSWTFNNYLNLVSEDDSTFAGAVLVNSLWGYNMGLTSGEWTNVYKMGSTEGKLSYKTGSNITAPAAGLYLIQADLKNLTYSHTAITSLSYAGLNDNWALTTMNTTSVAGVYSSPVTITAASQWGFKLYMNGNWDYFYGGTNGTLNYKGNGITDDATIGAGSYDLIADIRNTSYNLLGNKVYIGGINDAWDFTSGVLNKTATGIYSGTITITQASSWGIKIYLYKDNWDYFFGGSFSSLKFKGANITDDQSLAAGVYNVTIDFNTKKCTFTAQ
jgi:starch-binding outer membrane protein SusE/F